MHLYRLYIKDEGLSNIHDQGHSPSGHVYSMTPNPNCITGLYQNAVAFPFPIGSSRGVQCNLSTKLVVTGNIVIPSVDFIFAITIYAKSRSMLAHHSKGNTHVLWYLLKYTNRKEKWCENETEVTAGNMHGSGLQFT